MPERTFQGEPRDYTWQYVTERPELDEQAEDVVYASDPEPDGEVSVEAVEVGSELYQAVLIGADHQTGGPRTLFPAGCTLDTLVGCCTPGHAEGAVRSAIQAAIDHGDLLEWEDRGGATRVTPTDDDSLRELIATENARDEPRVALQERAIVHIGGGGS